MTSSPGPIPAASRPRCSPEVPELTATQRRPPVTRSANSSSKVATSGPWAIIPERMTRSTAARSSSPTIGLAGGMNVAVMLAFLRTGRGRGVAQRRCGPARTRRGRARCRAARWCRGSRRARTPAERLVGVGRDAELVEAVGVEPRRARRGAHRDGERRDVAGHRRLHAGHGPRADGEPLVQRGPEPDGGVVLDDGVAADQGRAGDRDAVTDPGVVTEVHLAHEHAVVADDGLVLPPGVDGHELLEDVARADHDAAVGGRPPPSWARRGGRGPRRRRRRRRGRRRSCRRRRRPGPAARRTARSRCRGRAGPGAR